jgi:Dynein heavy chain C-terminal domain
LKAKTKSDIDSIQENGLNIHGLFLQGASWDIENVRLHESNYGELWHEMPYIW